jgi:hypothetical protein
MSEEIEPLPITRDFTQVLRFFKERYASQEVEKKFYDFLKDALVKIDAPIIVTGISRSTDTSGVKVSCYTVRFYNEFNKNGIRYCLLVENEKITDVGLMYTEVNGKVNKGLVLH